MFGNNCLPLIAKSYDCIGQANAINHSCNVTAASPKIVRGYSIQFKTFGIAYNLVLSDFKVFAYCGCQFIFSAGRENLDTPISDKAALK